MATQKQIEYAEILLNEAGIDSTDKKRDFLQRRFGKSFLSDLTTKEASALIGELKEGD